MEAQNSHSSNIIEISMDVPRGERILEYNKTCGGSSCGFSYPGSNSKDSESTERFASMRKLSIAVVLCVIFMAVEVAGGIKANSLAILTDAMHLLSDVAAFAISLFSIWATGWEATPYQSYGFFRIEILGALVSIQLIWLLTGILVYEAIVRLIQDTGEVQGSLMFLVSAFGLVVNIIMAVLLGHDHGHGGDGDGHGEHSHSHRHHHDDHIHDDGHDAEHVHAHDTDTMAHHSHAEEQLAPLLHNSEEAQAPTDTKDAKTKTRNINVHSAYLHVLGDSVQSAGVMIGGAIIWWKPEWKIVDMICTLVFSVIVLITTIKMIRDILEVLMESTPRQIDATKLERGLCQLDGIVTIHELHIWAITVGKVLLACHVMITPEANADAVLDMVIGYIKREYNISHVTIQIERQ